MVIKEQLEQVEEKIQKACLAAGRDRKEVTLIGVSKTKPLSMLQEAYHCGLREFGENYPQELSQKAAEWQPEGIHWHEIGHLQTNKIKMILPYVTMIHSVDSLHLAQAISKEALRIHRVIPILIEVNVAGEESKFGLPPQEVVPFLHTINTIPGIQVRGLMTIAPYVEDSEENRPVFSDLFQLSVDIKRQNIDNVTMNELSMGMTGDFQVAIQEGATMIRVGTGIFGKRTYPAND